MKFHKTTADAVILVLEEVFIDGNYADKVIERVLKSNHKWGSRDRRFIAETSYEIIRWWRMVRQCGNITDDSITSLWKTFGTWCILNHIEVPKWPEFEGIKGREIFDELTKSKDNIAFSESIPDWLNEIGAAELKDKWPEEIHALNQQASVVLRSNRIKGTRNDLRQALAEQSIETDIISWAPDALILKIRKNVFQLPQFKEGKFEMQDAASQDVSESLQVKPGMRVIDACAGAGGKTLHLAALMNNQGKIIAMDLEDWKLDELKKRARRAGASNIETKVIEGSKTIKRLANTADRLLLDVPCSGLGVIKRNPDAKWKLSPEFIAEVKKTQQHILSTYSTMLKPGGLMVYSTCSILPSENEEQVAAFLKTHGEQFELINQKRHWPSEGFDGFYMALLKKK